MLFSDVRSHSSLNEQKNANTYPLENIKKNLYAFFVYIRKIISFFTGKMQEIQ